MSKEKRPAKFRNSDILFKFKTAWSVYPKDFMGLIIVAWAIPAVYSLINTFYIGQMEMEAMAISEQYEYVSVLLEILLEMFPVAVLALVAKHFTDTTKASSVIRTVLPMQLLVTVGFSLFIFFCASLFVDLMNTPIEIVSRTEDFLRVKALAIPFEAMGVLFIISIKALRKGRLAVGIALTGVVTNVVLDTLMISNLSFSLRLGLMGSAWDYVIAKIVVCVISATLFYLIIKQRPGISFDRKVSLAILKIGRCAGMESAIRNAGYILGMLIVLNTLGTSEYGGYGVAMTIFWMLFLIPILALTESTNIAIGHEYGKGRLDNMKDVHLVSFVLMVGYMLLVILIGAFVWEPISTVFNRNHEIVHFSVLTFQYLAIPYVFFAASSCLKSLFVGTGRTEYYLIPSMVANLGIYIPVGLMVKLDIWTPTFVEIMQVSFFVFAMDMILSFVLVQRLYKRIKMEIEYG